MKYSKTFSMRTGRGSVLLIAGLLFASAALRIGVGAGQAVATESPFAEQAAATDSPTTETAEHGDLSAYGELLTAFQRREAELLEKERQYEIHKKALAVADTEIERRLVALETAENNLRDMLALASTAAEDDLARLTAVYENMKPKDAAKLFEEMEPAFAAGFLGRMKPAAAAGIMAGLSPEAAYTVSVILAGRNAEVPRP